MKTCKSCHIPLPIDAFDVAPLGSGGRDGHYARCKQCRHEKKPPQTPKVVYVYVPQEKPTTTRPSKHISYNVLLQEQGGVCAICKRPPNGVRLSYDHNHKTNKFRALLCSKCNTLLGMCNEDVNVLKAAINYILFNP